MAFLAQLLQFNEQLQQPMNGEN